MTRLEILIKILESNDSNENFKSKSLIALIYESRQKSSQELKNIYESIKK